MSTVNLLYSYKQAKPGAEPVSVHFDEEQVVLVDATCEAPSYHLHQRVESMQVSRTNWGRDQNQNQKKHSRAQAALVSRSLSYDKYTRHATQKQKQKWSTRVLYEYE